jgi:diguanylate cyclase (GGDEF)-like protein
MVVANRHALPYRGDYDPARQMVFTRRLNPPAMPSLLVLPLLVHDRALGTLVLGSQRRGAFGDSVRPTLEVLASHVAVSLANARMLKRLEELATLDGLTGLLNKRALTELGTQKLKSATRFKKPLSLMVCDIDHFKKVNDTYGHDIGDLVIKGFGEVLRRVKRDTDIVGRFGGEEFVIACEETDDRGAAQLAERIRTELEATTFHSDQGQVKVTCSVGVAPFPAAGETWEALFKAADEALYVSKRTGRNRVTVWNPKLQGYAA